MLLRCAGGSLVLRSPPHVRLEAFEVFVYLLIYIPTLLWLNLLIHLQQHSTAGLTLLLMQFVPRFWHCSHVWFDVGQSLEQQFPTFTHVVPSELCKGEHGAKRSGLCLVSFVIMPTKMNMKRNGTVQPAWRSPLGTELCIKVMSKYACFKEAHLLVRYV